MVDANKSTQTQNSLDTGWDIPKLDPSDLDKHGCMGYEDHFYHMLYIDVQSHQIKHWWGQRNTRPRGIEHDISIDVSGLYGPDVTEFFNHPKTQERLREVASMPKMCGEGGHFQYHNDKRMKAERDFEQSIQRECREFLDPKHFWDTVNTSVADDYAYDCWGMPFDEYSMMRAQFETEHFAHEYGIMTDPNFDELAEVIYDELVERFLDEMLDWDELKDHEERAETLRIARRERVLAKIEAHRGLE